MENINLNNEKEEMYFKIANFYETLSELEKAKVVFGISGLINKIKLINTLEEMNKMKDVINDNEQLYDKLCNITMKNKIITTQKDTVEYNRDSKYSKSIFKETYNFIDKCEEYFNTYLNKKGNTGAFFKLNKNIINEIEREAFILAYNSKTITEWRVIAAYFEAFVCTFDGMSYISNSNRRNREMFGIYEKFSDESRNVISKYQVVEDETLKRCYEHLDVDTNKKIDNIHFTLKYPREILQINEMVCNELGFGYDDNDELGNTVELDLSKIKTMMGK